MDNLREQNINSLQKKSKPALIPECRAAWSLFLGKLMSSSKSGIVNSASLLQLLSSTLVSDCNFADSINLARTLAAQTFHNDLAVKCLLWMHIVRSLWISARCLQARFWFDSAMSALRMRAWTSDLLGRSQILFFQQVWLLFCPLCSMFIPFLMIFS